MTDFSRRRALLLSLCAPLVPLLNGCRASLPPWPAINSSDGALALLNDSAKAHGLSAYAGLHDLSVSYSGHWHRLVGILQPVLVDAGFRGGSEERLLFDDGIVAQSHSGPKGHKQVVRVNDASARSSVRVWFNAEESHDRDVDDAAALVADAYALFLLGPMLLAANQRPRRDIQAALGGTVEVTLDRQKHACDVLHLKISPGFGNSDSDEVALYIDHDSRLMLKVRMTLNGLESTRGALVDVDTYEHRSLHGIMWPTAFHERLLRPAPLDVHAWRLTGLDIDRGLTREELTGPEFAGQASKPATLLTG